MILEIILTICLFISIFFCFIYLYKYKKLSQLNGLLEQVKSQKFQIEQDLIELTNSKSKLEKQSIQLNASIKLLSTQLEQYKENVDRAEEIAESAASAIYEKVMDNMQTTLSNSAELESEKYNEIIQSYKEEYALIQQDCATSLLELTSETVKAKNILDELRGKIRAAIEANKRSLLEQEEQNFYMLQIPAEDLVEIAKLKSILPFIHNKEVFNKFIYKCYYEKPTTDLIGRVIGEKTSGIYKITNIENGMCYVGQCVRFSDRWRQHIKRGLGAETVTRNKLYPAMQSIGVEKFRFEIIEECPVNQLNERETYWQEFFGAKEFGYSIK